MKYMSNVLQFRKQPLYRSNGVCVVQLLHKLKDKPRYFGMQVEVEGEKEYVLVKVLKHRYFSSNVRRCTQPKMYTFSNVDK